MPLWKWFILKNMGQTIPSSAILGVVKSRTKESGATAFLKDCIDPAGRLCKDFKFQKDNQRPVAHVAFGLKKNETIQCHVDREQKWDVLICSSFTIMPNWTNRNATWEIRVYFCALHWKRNTVNKIRQFSWLCALQKSSRNWNGPFIALQ